MKIGGFTLIELLVVIAVIGILAAIAFPIFNDYRERSWDARAQSVATALYQAQEAYYVDHETYFDCTIISGVSTCGNLPGLPPYNDPELSAVTINLPGGFLAFACHQKAPHGFAFVTDPDHEHYAGGGLDQVNIEGAGHCSSFITELLP